VPVEATNLPTHLTAAEQSQLTQTLHQAQERAMNVAATERTQEQAKQEATDQVQETRQTEQTTVQGDRRGARSFDLKKRQAKEEKEEAPLPPEPPPPDPEGRGQRLVLQV
jgi:hypothetical protein